MNPSPIRHGTGCCRPKTGMKQTILTTLLILGLLLPCLSLHANGAPDALPIWNTSFPTNQEITLPIDTSLARSKGQPVDLPILFHTPCWTKDPLATSIRIVYWNGTGYTELPSQIYNLAFIDTTHLRSCNIVFLIPPIANGHERYFLHFSPNQTQSTTYPDHLKIVDQTYQFNPIQQIQANAQFYGIIEDNYDIFGIGQEGKILDRACAQVVVKQPKNTTTFDALNADQFVSFAFSYYYGPNEKDESSSDQVYVSKQILVDGTLMASVQITSQSNLGDVRTTNEYRYYYTPGDDKRLYVHATHQMLHDATVQGMDNIDGRFGSIISVEARSSTIDALNMGQISPLLDFNSTTQAIEEYHMDQNPETQDREWIIPYQDNADLGPHAWISYGDGPSGIANAVIFANNTGLIKTGTNEHDGISLKVCEKQYFNFLGTQVDYASINFGRNSYDPTTNIHDTQIPANLKVEFDAETFYSRTGGYTATQQETHLYQALINQHITPPEPPHNATHFNLTVNASFGGTFLAFPWLGQHTGTTYPAVTMDLYRNNTYQTTQQANRSLLISAATTFHNLTTGHYLTKVSLTIAGTRYLIGATITNLTTTTTTPLTCTWERDVKITVQNQHTHGIPNVALHLQNKNHDCFDHNTTDATGILTLRAPYNQTDPYTIVATYKNHTIATTTLTPTIQYATTTITLPLYNYSIKVTDTLNLPPTVNITPHLLLHNQTTPITPDRTDGTTYRFTNLLAGTYTAELQYRTHTDTLTITIPSDTTATQLQFTQTYPVNLTFYDLRGNTITSPDILIKVQRNNNLVRNSPKQNFNLPPATYQLLIYDHTTLIATKTIDLTNEHHATIVTSLDAQLPTLITSLSLILILLAALLTALRKIHLRTLFLTLSLSLILLTLTMPWWELSGATTTTPQATRHIAMYIQPGSLMETLTNQTTTQRTISEMPAQFTSFLNIVTLALTATGILAAAAATISIYKKLKVSLVIQAILLTLLTATAIIYVYGTAKLTDIGIGSLQGQGPLHVIIGGADLTMPSTWGLSSGYQLLILAALTTIAGLCLTIYDWRKTRQSSKTKNKS